MLFASLVCDEINNSLPPSVPISSMSSSNDGNNRLLRDAVNLYTLIQIARRKM